MGEIGWRQTLVRIEGVPNLTVLPAGPPSRRAADLVGRGLSQLLEEAATEFDLVVLDAPAFVGFRAEPLQMATAVDGVLVVARAGQTSRKAVANVLGTLNRLRAKVVGIVLNEVHKELSDSYYYYGYYRSYYHSGEESKRQDQKARKPKRRFPLEYRSRNSRRSQRLGRGGAGRQGRVRVARGTPDAREEPGRRTRINASSEAQRLREASAAPVRIALNGLYMNYNQWQRDTILRDYEQSASFASRLQAAS